MVVRRLPESSELYHHGIKGQKWGVRRYQNADGSYTTEGKARLEQYRTNEIAGVNARINNLTNTYTKRDEKLKKKVEKFKEKGNTVQANRYEKTRESYKKMYEKGKSKCEDEIKALNKYTLADFEKESHNVKKMKGQAAVKTALETAGGMALGAVTGVGVVSVHYADTQAYKTAERMNKLKSGKTVQTIEARKLKQQINNATSDAAKARLKERYEEQLKKDKEMYGE